MSDDIVAELDRWAADIRRMSGRSVDADMLRRARDEIVALRTRCAASDVDTLFAMGRVEALEEAAHLAAYFNQLPPATIAAAIRALKDKR